MQTPWLPLQRCRHAQIGSKCHGLHLRVPLQGGFFCSKVHVGLLPDKENFQVCIAASQLLPAILRCNSTLAREVWRLCALLPSRSVANVIMQCL